MLVSVGKILPNFGIWTVVSPARRCPLKRLGTSASVFSTAMSRRESSDTRRRRCDKAVGGEVADDHGLQADISGLMLWQKSDSVRVADQQETRLGAEVSR